MSATKAPVLLTPDVLSPEITDLFVLLEGDYEIGHQVKAIGTHEQIKEKYGEEATVINLKKLDLFLQDHSADVYRKELGQQEHIQQQKKYEAEIKAQFPIGSVVQLKSGGPKMTVESIDGYWNVRIHTVFYLDNREITKQEFIPEVLKLVADKKEELLA